MNSIAVVLTAAIITTILVAISILVQGYVLTWLWYWFMVPLGAPHLNIAMAFGVALVTRALIDARNRSQKKYEDLGELLLEALGEWFGYFIVLFIGWIVMHFV